MLAVAIAAVLVVGRAGASSSTYVLKASLSTKAVSSVKDASQASGTLVGKLEVAGKNSSFVWTLSFKHLSGTATRAGIYVGAPGKTGQLAMLLCLRCISGAKSSYHGSYVASSTFVRSIVHSGAFVAVRTKRNPNGEISGQIKATTG
jgi:hypothetical protein